MKKYISLLVAAAFAVILLSATAFAVDLIADGGDPLTAVTVGTVTITNDAGANTVTVTCNTSGTWYLLETHVDADTVLADIPQNRNGNPKVGRFEEGDEYTAASLTVTDTFVLSVSHIATETIYVAVQAVVYDSTDIVGYLPGPDGIPGNADDIPIYREESAWGEGLLGLLLPQFNAGKSWAMYIEYIAI